MGVERYVIEAVVRDGWSHREVARSAGVSKAWVTKLLARYRDGGDAALEPRSRRPKSCAHAASDEIQAAIVALRHQLEAAGYDSGPHTIAHHLQLTHTDIPSVATIWRILTRHGLITPQPQKQPKSSYIRFEASLPNEMWQSDFTHWQLADGRDVEILNYIDDHSRMLMACDVFAKVKGLDVVQTFVCRARRRWRKRPLRPRGSQDLQRIHSPTVSFAAPAVISGTGFESSPVHYRRAWYSPPPGCPTVGLPIREGRSEMSSSGQHWTARRAGP